MIIHLIIYLIIYFNIMNFLFDEIVSKWREKILLSYISYNYILLLFV